MTDLSKINRQVITANLYSAHRATSEKILTIRFETEDILVDHGILHRIEFREKQCNVTLKNQTTVKQTVNVRVWVLNGAINGDMVTNRKRGAHKLATRSVARGELGIQAFDFRCGLERKSKK